MRSATALSSGCALQPWGRLYLADLPINLFEVFAIIGRGIQDFPRQLVEFEHVSLPSLLLGTKVRISEKPAVRLQHRVSFDFLASASMAKDLPNACSALVANIGRGLRVSLHHFPLRWLGRVIFGSIRGMGEPSSQPFFLTQFYFAAATTFFAASVSPLAVAMFSAALRQDLAALLDVGAFQPDHQRHLEA